MRETGLPSLAAVQSPAARSLSPSIAQLLGDERWEDFKGNYDDDGFEGSRLGGDLGSGRYDIVDDLYFILR